VVNASHGNTVKGVQIMDKNNPFMKLIKLLRQHSLVKAHAIHVEIHQNTLPVDKPVEIDSEVLDSVYDAISARIEALEDSKGALFLREIFSDKASASTSRGKFEAVLRMLELGAAEDLPLLIFNNKRYRDALGEAKQQAPKAPNVFEQAEIDVESGEELPKTGLPHRSFFKMMADAVMGAALTPVVAPVVDRLAEKAGVGDPRGPRIDRAVEALKSHMQRGKFDDAGLRKILEAAVEEHPVQTGAAHVAASGLAYYLSGEPGSKKDPLGQFITALAQECNAVPHPVFTFSPNRGVGNTLG